MENETKLDRLTAELFKDGPGEHLATVVSLQILKESHFRQIFGTSVDDYDREDYSLRELPALRVYVNEYTKEQESHYINGDIELDVIFPASIRRGETEKYPARVASALLQQFRRPNYFICAMQEVPGLNELGKVFNVNKNLTFQNTEMTDECPVVKLRMNFRIDLKQWDEYLESQGRTKDDPFDRTLEELKRIASVIKGVRVDDDVRTVAVELGTDQKIGG